MVNISLKYIRSDFKEKFAEVLDCIRRFHRTRLATVCALIFVECIFCRLVPDSHAFIFVDGHILPLHKSSTHIFAGVNVHTWLPICKYHEFTTT